MSLTGHYVTARPPVFLERLFLNREAVHKSFVTSSLLFLAVQRTRLTIALLTTATGKFKATKPHRAKGSGFYQCLTTSVNW